MARPAGPCIEKVVCWALLRPSLAPAVCLVLGITASDS